MSLLICTPIYEGNLKFPYFQSMLALQSALEGNLEFDILATTNESLIQRARNTSAAKFLQTSYKKMLFIDSDIEFTPEDVAKLWNLDEEVAVGVYPMKRQGSGYAAWQNGSLVEDLDELELRTDGTAEVDYAGTGFMMIDRLVFERMKTSEIEHEESGPCWAFFNPRVKDGVYLSEDYAFCHDFREMGGKVIMDPSVKLIHHGTYGYG